MHFFYSGIPGFLLMTAGNVQTMHDSELRAIYTRHGETIDPNQRGFSLHIQKAFPEVHRFSICVFQVSWFKDN